MAIFSKSKSVRYAFFRGYATVVLASRRGANMSKILVFEPFAKLRNGWFQVGL